MFIGHYAVALAAKKAAPRTSLGLLFIAAQFLDLLWPVLLLLGVEQVRLHATDNSFLQLDFVNYPFSHSLLGSVIWAVAFGGLVYLVKRDVRAALVIAGCVVSHWVLDLFTHVPDLPLTFTGAAREGLGLWNFPVATIIVETLLYGVGIVLYVQATRATDRIGKFGFWSLVGFLFLLYVSSIIGPPPPDVSVIGYMGLLLWIFVVWAWWSDKHRTMIVEKSRQDPSAAKT